ncbi:unnamed protein product [Arctogadus glacialis]
MGGTRRTGENGAPDLVEEGQRWAALGGLGGTGRTGENRAPDRAEEGQRSKDGEDWAGRRALGGLFCSISK